MSMPPFSCYGMRCLNPLGTWMKLFLIVTIFYIGALPLIITDYEAGRAFNDQELYHYPTIEHFKHSCDISDYPSATTPGYHLLLAPIARLTPDSKVTLKLVSSLLTALLFATLASIIVRKLGCLDVVACLLPAMTSIYLFPSGVWLLPDNLAWLTVLCVLFFATRSPIRFWPYLVSGFALSCAVLVRQANIWLACVILVRGLFCCLHAPSLRNRIGHLSGSIFSTFPAFVLLGFFIWRWGALVPPSFVSRHQVVNPAVPAFFLAVFFLYSVFYIPYCAHVLKELIHERGALLLILFGFIVGLVLSLVTQTDYNWVEGRASGLWNVVRIAPVIYHRSLLICIMSSLGGATAVGLVLLTKGLTRWTILTAIPVFVMSQMANHFAFERYFAGFIFIILFLIIGDIRMKPQAKRSYFPPVFPLILAAFNLVVLVGGLL